MKVATIGVSPAILLFVCIAPYRCWWILITLKMIVKLRYAGVCTVQCLNANENLRLKYIWARSAKRASIFNVNWRWMYPMERMYRCAVLNHSSGAAIVSHRRLSNKNDLIVYNIKFICRKILKILSVRVRMG